MRVVCEVAPAVTIEQPSRPVEAWGPGHAEPAPKGYHGAMLGPTPSHAIRCSGLVKRYGDVVAVAGLDLAIRPGECFGLLGPNGAGKTTTVEILEGLTRPNAGTVEVLGERWGRSDRRLRCRLGIQLQETKLIEKLTVRETIKLFRSFYDRGLTPQAAMELVGLEEKADTWVRKLSGGQTQRLSLACALVGDPEVLFLDEPTTGLDPQARLKIWDIVGDLRSRSRTVLLTTHYMEEAHRLCDRVAIIDHGRIIVEGTPSELIGSLEAQHVVEFQARTAVSHEVLAGLDGVRSVEEENGSIRLIVDQVHRTVPVLLQYLAREGLHLTRLSTHHATLEDVFVSLTGRHLRNG
jgi:ABC-2 type transport system ATP-binding protein